MAFLVFRIWRGIDVHFAHQVRGHQGSCIHIHGHTWKLEVCCAAETLDREGFVVDFRRMSHEVLQPAHALLDHSLVVGKDTFAEVEAELASLGGKLVASRALVHGKDAAPLSSEPLEVNGAKVHYPGGMKVAVFPFSPTSERLAEWLWSLTNTRIADARVQVPWARVYETLHPVESVAEYVPARG